MAYKKGARAVKVTVTPRKGGNPKGNPENLKKGHIKLKDELTDKQRTFAHEYCVDFSKTGAARRSGCSEKNPGEAGYDLYNNPLVKALIDEILAERAEENKHLHDRIREELKLIAFSDATEFMQMTKNKVKSKSGDGAESSEENGVLFTPSALWEKRRGKLIKTIKISKGKVELSLYDKNDALKQLALHTGFYKEPEDQTKLKITIKKKG